MDFIFKYYIVSFKYDCLISIITNANNLTNLMFNLDFEENLNLN